MNSTRYRVPAALLASALAAGFLVTWGCGETASTPAAADGGGLARPPGPEGAPTTSTEERVYAINAIWLGDTDRAGNVNDNAWKSFGYDLDGVVTNPSVPADLAKVCKPGSDNTAHQDGDRGIDNAFGKSVLRLLENVVGSPSTTLTQSMTVGDFSVFFKITGMTDDPAQTNTGLGGAVVIGGKFSDAGVPTFTTADDWPYVAGSEVPLTGSYITRGQFANGGKDTITLSLGIGGQTLTLELHNAFVSFKHPSASGLEEGTIAGVADSEAFATGIATIAGRFSASFCNGLAVEVIKGQIRSASDSLLDGTADPTRPCNAISVGLGFTARQIGPLKTVAVSPPESPSLCDGGADAGDGGT